MEEHHIRTSAQEPTLHKPFDNITKRSVRKDPSGFVVNLLGIEDASELEVIETEQLSMKTHFADSFIRATIQGKKAIIHCEFQTRDSQDTPMPLRMAAYIGIGIEFYKLPIYSHVIYLYPDAGHNDPGAYIQVAPGYNIRIEYRVLRLCDMDGQAVLNAGRIGLIPFAGLMQPPSEVTPSQWIQKCVQAVESVAVDETQLGETLADLAILSGLTYNFETIHDIISEETVLESSVIQHFIERGIEQGAKRMAIENILLFLNDRFETNTTPMLQSTLEEINDLERLKALVRESARAESLGTFIDSLVKNGDAT